MVELLNTLLAIDPEYVQKKLLFVWMLDAPAS